MKIFLDCLPCMLRQVLEAAYMATDESIHERIMEDAINTLVNYKDFDCAPILCETMPSIIKQHIGGEDPMLRLKHRILQSR